MDTENYLSQLEQLGIRLIVLPSFLQSKEWLDFQRSIGHEVFEYDKEGIRTGIIKHALPFGKNYLYIPHGPEMDLNSMSGGIKNPINNFVTYLKSLAKDNKSIFIKSEPYEDKIAQLMVEAGFKKSKKEIQPKKTVILDLTQEEDVIIANTHHKTRYNIKVAERYGIVVTEKKDIEPFIIMLNKTSKRDGFHAHPATYYRKLIALSENKNLGTHLFVAEYGGKPAAAALIMIRGGIGYYLHGASDYNLRAVMAPYALHSHIMKFLKSKNIKEYDMWGIDANRWPGVTRFKLGWGGQVKEYPGAFDLVSSKPWYLIYNMARKMRIS